MLSYDSYLKIKKAIQDGRSDEARNILSAFTTAELVDACIRLLDADYTPIRFVRLVDEIVRSRGDQTWVMPAPFKESGHAYRPAWERVRTWDDFIAKAGRIYFHVYRDDDNDHASVPSVKKGMDDVEVMSDMESKGAKFPTHVMEPDDALEFLEALNMGYSEKGHLSFHQAYYIAYTLKELNIPRPSELVTSTFFGIMYRTAEVDDMTGERKKSHTLLVEFIDFIKDSVPSWNWPPRARDALYTIGQKWETRENVPVDISSISLPERLSFASKTTLFDVEKEHDDRPELANNMFHLVHEYIMTRAYETDLMLVDGHDRLFGSVEPWYLMECINILLDGSCDRIPIPNVCPLSKWFVYRISQLVHLRPGDIVETFYYPWQSRAYWMYNGTNVELVATSTNYCFQCPPGYLSVIPPGFFDGALNEQPFGHANFTFKLSTEELRAMAPDNTFKCIEIPTFCTHTAEYWEDPDDLPPTTAAIPLETPYGPVLLIAMPAWWDDWEWASDVIIEPCRSVSSALLLQLLSCPTTELVAANKGRATVEVDGTSYTLVGVAIYAYYDR